MEKQLSREYGPYSTVKAGFWPWHYGKILQHLEVVPSSLGSGRVEYRRTSSGESLEPMTLPLQALPFTNPGVSNTRHGVSNTVPGTETKTHWYKLFSYHGGLPAGLLWREFGVDDVRQRLQQPVYLPAPFYESL